MFGIVEIDNVVAASFQLGLNEKSQELRITTVAIDNQDFFETVSTDLVTSGVQQVPHHTGGKGKGAGLMLGFINLAVEIVWENDCILLLGGSSRPFTDLNQVRTHGDVGSVLLQDTDGKNAGISGFFLRLGPVASRKLVPPGRQILGG